MNKVLKLGIKIFTCHVYMDIYGASGRDADVFIVKGILSANISLALTLSVPQLRGKIVYRHLNME